MDRSGVSDVGITLGPCTNEPKLTNDVLDPTLLRDNNYIVRLTSKHFVIGKTLKPLSIFQPSVLRPNKWYNLPRNQSLLNDTPSTHTTQNLSPHNGSSLPPALVLASPELAGGITIDEFPPADPFP